MPGIMNPIIGIIKNTTANTYHPIVFVESLPPGPIEDFNPNSFRVKSKMHHTFGFPTKEEAVKNINESLVQSVSENFIGTPKLDLEAEIEWNGDGIPIITCFFIDGKLA